MTDVKTFLDEQVLRFNTPSFIDSDPVQFPRRYKKLQDIEIVAFVIATISWGKRPMILRNAERLLAVFGNSPLDFVMNEDYRMFGNANIHRTFFEHDLVYMLRGFRRIYGTYGSLENMLKAYDIEQAAAPVWAFVKVLSNEMLQANDGQINSKCYPVNCEKSALKRINMALRWLVRDDGIVDLGVWKALKPGQLYIPLDVHVGNVARGLGILLRGGNDRRAVEELTAVLREFCPEDPVRYDFALFGIGVNKTD
ncbi:MAG: TIGR02757 family protein [Dysgonamonadaceae bacterium]|jgi:uncharacterized protein (TIGR02757 family)|nr:TIGR02757 family protein [Dysgonamonadaceae bacterium]